MHIKDLAIMLLFILFAAISVQVFKVNDRVNELYIIADSIKYNVRQVDDKVDKHYVDLYHKIEVTEDILSAQIKETW